MSDAPVSSHTPEVPQAGSVGMAFGSGRSQWGNGASGTGRGSAASGGVAREGPQRGDLASGTDRLAAAFAGAAREGRAAALMPYLMGGYPTLADSVRIGEACVAGRRGRARARRALLRPARRRARDPRGRDRTRSPRGPRSPGCWRSLARSPPRVPVVLMCYANMVLAPGAEAFVQRLARTGACGLIVPDLPFEEAGEVLAACDAHGLALVPLVAPTTPPARLAEIGARARGFLYTVSVVGTTGERAALAERFAEVVARARAATAVPVALGFGISTPAQARQAADAGADGVIVGSRLVRAAGDAAGPAGAGDPAGAVGALVAELAAGLER